MERTWSDLRYRRLEARIRSAADRRAERRRWRQWAGRFVAEVLLCVLVALSLWGWLVLAGS